MATSLKLCCTHIKEVLRMRAVILPFKERAFKSGKFLRTKLSARDQWLDLHRKNQFSAVGLFFWCGNSLKSMDSSLWSFWTLRKEHCRKSWSKCQRLLWYSVRREGLCVTLSPSSLLAVPCISSLKLLSQAGQVMSAEISPALSSMD